MAQRFDDGVVLGELLGVRVGELDGAAPAATAARAAPTVSQSVTPSLWMREHFYSC